MLQHARLYAMRQGESYLRLSATTPRVMVSYDEVVIFNDTFASDLQSLLLDGIVSYCVFIRAVLACVQQ